MRSTSIGLALVLCVSACAGLARAESVASEPADALPSGLSAYASGDAAANAAFAPHENDAFLQTDPATSAASKTQSYWPVLYSALIPGVGELTMGYTVRGVALMAIEVGAWTGYFLNHDDGMQMRDQYEAFADQYWSQRKFIDDHPLVYPQTGWTQEQLEEAGRAVSGSGGDWWTGYIPYVPKDVDKQHYYENLGKYDWFLSGWSDYNPALPPPAPTSALRDQYRAMRNESNSSLDHADAFVWLSLATRVVSIVETTIIVHNRRDNGAQSSTRGPDLPVMVRARPRGFSGAELALEVRFK
jgi:hypothetical protein